MSHAVAVSPSLMHVYAPQRSELGHDCHAAALLSRCCLLLIALESHCYPQRHGSGVELIIINVNNYIMRVEMAFACEMANADNCVRFAFYYKEIECA